MRIDELGLNRFVEGLVAGQQGRCAAMLDHYLSRQTPIIDIYQYLFQPALYRIGELWEQGQISVATEHMATAIIEGLMDELYPRLLPAARRPLKAVIAFVEGELHQVGGKMVADVLVMNGWEVRYLSTNTPMSELLRMVEVEKPQVAGLSLSAHDHLPLLAKTLDVLQSRFPKLTLLVGGQGFSKGGAEIIAKFPNARLIESLHQLDRFATRLADRFEPQDQGDG
jgi:MerR family transcriptional regulator, light-induced transcriptional regulator